MNKQRYRRAERAIELAANSAAGPVVWGATDAEPIEVSRKKVAQHAEREAAELHGKEMWLAPELAALEATLEALDAINAVADWITRDERAERRPDEVKAAAKRAEQLRGKARSVGPVQVERVKSVLSKYGNGSGPMEVVKAFKSIADAKSYATGGEVERPVVVAELSKKLEDPFARSRGLTAICLALAGK